MGSTVNISYGGIGEMLKSAAMQAEMERRANLGKDFAEGIAPFDEHDGDHYKDHFSVEPRPRHDRACAALVNDDPAAFQIEHGTSNSPAHHTLTRSLDAMGD